MSKHDNFSDSDDAPSPEQLAAAVAPGRYIDAFEFVRLGKSAQGNAPITWFERLVEDMPEQEPGAMVSWSAHADKGPLGEPLIVLGVDTVLTVQCERCLGPMPVHLASEVPLHVVETEAELDDPDSFDVSELDAFEAGEAFDKVLGTRKFDLFEQVEDELILCVPYVPKHDVCPEGALPPGLGADEIGNDDEREPSPFAALAKLKGKPDLAS
jgi:uncharacterized protein